MSDSKKILVVDDEAQILRVLRRSLSAHRFEVRAASDGESALVLFREWLPDLVISDLSMSLMDGLRLCREIRKISEVPIIVLSVKGEEKTKVEALDSGADDYLTKPFGIDELLARVRAALRRTPSERSEAMRLEVGGLRLGIFSSSWQIIRHLSAVKKSISRRKSSNC
jgi:two-component system, OmpR family, KDP operon response regulator KdpE